MKRYHPVKLGSTSFFMYTIPTIVYVRRRKDTITRNEKIMLIYLNKLVELLKLTLHDTLSKIKKNKQINQ